MKGGSGGTMSAAFSPSCQDVMMGLRCGSLSAEEHSGDARRDVSDIRCRILIIKKGRQLVNSQRKNFLCSERRRVGERPMMMSIMPRRSRTVRG